MKTIFATVLGVGLAVGAASVASADIYMAGDSTMCNYNPAKQYPQQGWGQALALFMKDPSRLHNKAVGGRSAKSFKAEGRWQSIVDALKPGDCVIETPNGGVDARLSTQLGLLKKAVQSVLNK